MRVWMNNLCRSSFSTLCTEESDTSQTNKRSPSVPSLCPGILPLALQSLHSSVGLPKARPCRRLQWAAVMGLKLCALISLSVSTGFQRSHNPTLILPVISLPFPLSFISQKHVCCLWLCLVSIADELLNSFLRKSLLVLNISTGQDNSFFQHFYIRKLLFCHMKIRLICNINS